jgi:hypothetical protein
MKKTYLFGAEALVSVVVLFLVSVRLESVPPLWWDERWTLSVARNWIETGRYQRLLAGALGTPWEAGPTLTGSTYIPFSYWCWCFSGPHVWGLIYTGELDGHLLFCPPAL